MVSPGVLQIPEVKRWLAGVEPHDLLELDSLMACERAVGGKSRPTPGGKFDEPGPSWVFDHPQRRLLLDAQARPGLELTATGT